MCAYGKNLVALKMSFHNVGAIVQDAQSSCKRQDAAFAATRPDYKQSMLIFQSDLVLPISVQILHISHSLPASTPRISTNHNYSCSFGWYVGATLFNRLLISPVSEYAASFNISRLSKKCSLSNSIGFPIWISLFLVS